MKQFKGAVSRDFLTFFYFINRTLLGPEKLNCLIVASDQVPFFLLILKIRPIFWIRIHNTWSTCSTPVRIIAGNKGKIYIIPLEEGQGWKKTRIIYENIQQTADIARLYNCIYSRGYPSFRTEQHSFLQNLAPHQLGQVRIKILKKSNLQYKG